MRRDKIEFGGIDITYLYFYQHRIYVYLYLFRTQKMNFTKSLSNLIYIFSYVTMHFKHIRMYHISTKITFHEDWLRNTEMVIGMRTPRRLLRHWTIFICSATHSARGNGSAKRATPVLSLGAEIENGTDSSAERKPHRLPRTRAQNRLSRYQNKKLIFLY